MIKVKIPKDTPIVVATANENKIREIVSIWGSKYPLVTLRSIYPGVVSPDEPETTYEGNAIIKARHAASVSSMPSLADDSGISIRPLGGWPGAASTREVVDWFPGDPKKLYGHVREQLLNIRPDQRTATVECCIALAFPDQGPCAIDGASVIVAKGQIHGKIVAPRGENGFGFDSIFEVAGTGYTLAEMTNEAKNVNSARSIALKKMAASLK